jgi:hypothetical protein
VSAAVDRDRFAAVGDDELVIEWHIQRHIMFTWEMDLEELEKQVPAALSCVEVRPGIGLFSVAAVFYQPGNFGPGSSEFLELVSVAHVESDLSMQMPLSRFSMHAIAVWSDSPDFIKQEGEKLFTPTRLDPSLRAMWDDDWAGAELVDDAGPILTMRSTNPKPVYARDEMWGQHYNDTHGLHRGIWEWDGDKCEHMLHPPGAPPNAATFHAGHAFWQGMNLARVRGVYRQMIPRPGSTGTERFYKVRPYAPAVATAVKR